MTIPRVTAPFTPHQVASLNAYQQSSGPWHPFTCGKCRANLIATPEGWRCANDDYQQDWAHEFMADWTWRQWAEKTPI